MRTRLAILHHGPFFIYHDLGIGLSELLDLESIGIGQRVSMKVKCCQSGCFLVRPFISLRISRPCANKDEPEHYGINDAKYGVNEAGNCVMLFMNVNGG